MILRIKLIIVYIFLLTFQAQILSSLKIEILNIALLDPIFTIVYCIFISYLVIIGLLHICKYYAYIDMTKEEIIEYEIKLNEMNKLMR